MQSLEVVSFPFIIIYLSVASFDSPFLKLFSSLLRSLQLNILWFICKSLWSDIRFVSDVSFGVWMSRKQKNCFERFFKSTKFSQTNLYQYSVYSLNNHYNLFKLQLVRLFRDTNVNDTESFCQPNMTISDYIPDGTGLLSTLHRQLCGDKIKLFREIPSLLFASQVNRTCLTADW